MTTVHTVHTHTHTHTHPVQFLCAACRLYRLSDHSVCWNASESDFDADCDETTTQCGGWKRLQRLQPVKLLNIVRVRGLWPGTCASWTRGHQRFCASCVEAISNMGVRYVVRIISTLLCLYRSVSVEFALISNLTVVYTRQLKVHFESVRGTGGLVIRGL